MSHADPAEGPGTIMDHCWIKRNDIVQVKNHFFYVESCVVLWFIYLFVCSFRTMKEFANLFVPQETWTELKDTTDLQSLFSA